MEIGVKHAYDKRMDWCPTVSDNILSTISVHLCSQQKLNNKSKQYSNW